MSRYGTSWQRWVLSGLGIVAFFALASIVLGSITPAEYPSSRSQSADQTAGALYEPILQSVEVFLHFYPNFFPHGQIERALSLLESVFGLVYFGVGFTLLMNAVHRAGSLRALAGSEKRK